MRPAARNRTSTQDGQVLAIFAIFLVVLLGFTALASDYGSWLSSRRNYQNVVDAASIAGSALLTRPDSAAKRRDAREAAWQSLKDQLGLSINPAGLRNSDTAANNPVVDAGYSMWVSTPPINAGTRYPGAITGSASRTIFVAIEKDNPSFFSRILGITGRTIDAWATAGLFASRWAVITLREPNQNPSNVGQDITLAGTNTYLEVVAGDVGGNWNMKLNSTTQLWLRDASNNDADVYLEAYISCGQSCWDTAPSQINSGPNGSPPFQDKQALQLVSPIADPDYQFHNSLAGLPNVGGTARIPKAAGTNGSGDLTVNNGDSGGVDPVTGFCGANPVRIGPGWYHDLHVRGGECVVLDPTNNYSDPTNVLAPGQSPVPSTQQPGIFYFTGVIDVNNGALVVGDGVTVVIRATTGNGGGQLIANGSGAVDLNTGGSDGAAGFPPDLRKGAFLVDGSSTYLFDSVAGVWTYNGSVNSLRTLGTAVYVVKPSQLGPSAVDASTDAIQVNAGAALSWTGATYAPHDNVRLSGQPAHSAIGQLVSWTVVFDGGTTIRQIFDGIDESTPRLIEPTLGQ